MSKKGLPKAIAGVPLSWVTEKIPYVLAALLGIATWAITHAADRLLESPIVKVEIVRKWDAVDKTVVYQLTNLSRDERFDGLEVVVSIPGKRAKVTDARQRPHAPMLFGENDRPDAHTDYTATFLIPPFQPGWKDSLEVTLTGDATPELLVRASPQPIRLIEASLETFLVEHEVALLLGIAVTSLLAAATYLVLLVRHQRKRGMLL